MYLIVSSTADPASVNITQQLLEYTTWTTDRNLNFQDKPVFFYKDLALMVTIEKYHLYFDNLDKVVPEVLSKQGFEVKLEVVIFASKHRSASGMRTLTIHPIGNYQKVAEYGGYPEELVPSAPHEMTVGYRRLLANAVKEYGGNLEHEITFEVTHHGPYLDTPSFFIEIGSDDQTWVDPRAGKVIAQTIIDLISQDLSEARSTIPVAIGVGGGHYAPRHSDIVRKKRLAIGHMIPNYALEGISDRMLLTAIERTPGAKYVYFHRKALKKDKYRELKTRYSEKGYEPIQSDDLDDQL